MTKKNINAFLAFLAVAKEGSFTKAAAQIGISQSALSHTIRQLETRLDIRLLARTTRSVALTEAGERLFRRIAPRFEEIEAEIEAIGEFRDRPSGNIRISATDYAIETILWPKLQGLVSKYPEIRLELNIDYGLSDIVADRFDAGVRLGEQVAKDMISVKIGPDVRFAVVGAPGYFAQRPKPQSPQDLVDHSCITLRLPTHGGLYAWEFGKDGHEVRVRVGGQLVFNSVFQVLKGCLAGFGLGHMPEEIVAPHLADGTLVRVLEDWCPLWDGHHLYYPSRRQSSPAFALLVDALRHRA